MIWKRAIVLYSLLILLWTAVWSPFGGQDGIEYHVRYHLLPVREWGVGTTMGPLWEVNSLSYSSYRTKYGFFCKDKSYVYYPLGHGLN
jgi:hypothetical protein